MRKKKPRKVMSEQKRCRSLKWYPVEPVNEMEKGNCVDTSEAA